MAIAVLMCLLTVTSCGGNNNSNNNTTSGSENTSAQSPSDSGNSSTSQTPGRTEAEEAATVSEAPKGDDVRFADAIDIIIDNNPVSHLNAFLGGSPAQIWSFNLMFDRLLYYAGAGDYRASLAKEWSTEDYKTFNFTLRDDVYFHNGEKLTADDVVFTVNYGKNPETSTNSTWPLIDTATALDEQNVQIVLKNPDVDFYFRISAPGVPIINEKAVNDNPATGMTIGTGAFSLVEFVENNYWSFERNDNYWGEAPITKKITMRYIPELASRTIMMQNKESQLCLKTNPDDMDLFVGNPDYWIDDHIVNNPTLIQFNMTDPICKDYNFRMAIASAINRAEIALVAGGEYYMGDYESGGVWGHGTEFRNTDIPMVPEDIEAAKEYLELSPYNGETIEIAAINMVTTARAAEVVQEQLSKINIKIDIKLMENVALTEYTQWGNNRSQIIMNPIAFSSSASSYRSAVYPGSPANRTSYDNPVVSEMLDRAAQTFDYDERGDIYREIQATIAEDPPFFNMWYLLQTVVAVKGIGGFNFPGDNLYDFRYIYWQIEG